MSRRELVLAAFDRRPDWLVTVQNTECGESNLSGVSLFFWGEYESINWEQVHTGEASVLYTCLPATNLLLVHLISGFSTQSVYFAMFCSLGQQHACCYCFRKGLIRKAHLCHNTKKWAAKHPEGWLAKNVPEAFIFELDDIDYIEEALCDVPEVFSSQAACTEFG